MSRGEPLATILINNYNYASFISDAIDSALAQTYTNIEVVVVDDGSTDASREIITSYGDRIVSIFKDNGGQASTFNAGIAASRGEVICLLDADDFFFPDKVERVLPRCKPNVVVHHRLQLLPGPGFLPATASEPLDAYRHARRFGYIPYLGSPTSGIAIHRDLALKVFPIPAVKVSADDFVVRGAALLGEVDCISDVLGAYRVHGGNLWFGSRAPKSIDYMQQMEHYLNEKLVQAGKEPVIDFNRGMYGRDYIPQRARDLIGFAIKVFLRNPEPATYRFVKETVARALLLARTRDAHKSAATVTSGR